ncbi:hypothetical protein NIIDMKKI_06660 [Mycobacterium kansasii]|uniref:Uncharacterized protein n=1 Tax=Mycobacterium kansasii TaxID=1768 RepID=A0A7G1I357_MYCKA|nr:hypothetical protein NIIDMKKI_06660 [Mycobacterium kansasii]
MDSRDPYIIISADCHAELPTERYREYIDPEYREDFEAFLVEKAAAAQVGGLIDEQFAQAWFSEHGDGIAGGWDVGLRDKELDGDGVVGEVIFPDADAVSGSPGPRSAPAWPSRATSTRAGRWPGHGPTTAGWPSCAATAPSGGPGWRSYRYWRTSMRRWPRSPAPLSPGCGAGS